MINTKIYQNSWSTPRDFWELLNDKYDFDYDPCPINYVPGISVDGLKCVWGERNWVNPPFSLELKTALCLKAIQEYAHGHKSLLLLPVSTSTVLYHDHLKKFPIEFLRGRLKFEGIDNQGKWVNAGTGIGRHPANDLEWDEKDKISQTGRQDLMLVNIGF